MMEVYARHEVKPTTYYTGSFVNVNFFSLVLSQPLRSSFVFSYSVLFSALVTIMGLSAFLKMRQFLSFLALVAYFICSGSTSPVVSLPTGNSLFFFVFF